MPELGRAESPPEVRAGADRSSIGSGDHVAQGLAFGVECDRFSLVLLVKADNVGAQSDGAVDEIQDAHMSHLADLHDSGYLLAAGPLGDDHYRGAVLLRADPGTAREMMRNDPAVQAGRFDLLVLPWMVPGGAMHFSPTHFPRSVAEVDRTS
jgi:uncharacterized protein